MPAINNPERNTSKEVDQEDVARRSKATAPPKMPTIITPKIHHEAQELAGLENSIVEKESELIGDYVTAQTYDSFASLSGLKINVPEVHDQEATFVYNYFGILIFLQCILKQQKK